MVLVTWRWNRHQSHVSTECQHGRQRCAHCTWWRSNNQLIMNLAFYHGSISAMLSINQQLDQLTQAPHNCLTWVINLRNLKRKKKKNKMGLFLSKKKKGTESQSKTYFNSHCTLFLFSCICFPNCFCHFFNILWRSLQTHMHTKEVIKTVNCPKQWLHYNRHGWNCPKHNECLATDMDGTVQSAVSA